MQICRNKVSKKVYVLLEEEKNNQAYFISPKGNIRLVNMNEFEEFYEETNVMYLKSYGVITNEQYRINRRYTE
jgi:hypothetical protein